MKLAILSVVITLSLFGIAYGQTEMATVDTVQEEILISAQFGPHENEYIEGGYRVDSFLIKVSNDSQLCPTNNCEYDIEDGEFRTNSFTGGYVFEGKIKATVSEGDTKKSKFYPMRADLEKTGSEETSSTLTEILGGDIGLGGTVYQPEIAYQVVNGTLEVNEEPPTLLLHGVS